MFSVRKFALVLGHLVCGGCLVGTTALQATVLSSHSDWRSAWEALDDSRDIADRRWQVTGSLTIREEFKVSHGVSEWEIGAGHTVRLANHLRTTETERSILSKQGRGQLVLDATGQLGAGLRLEEGSVHIARDDPFRNSSAQIHAYSHTRLSYADGVQIDSPLQLRQDSPGVFEWVVAQGRAVQQGAIFNDQVAVDMLGAGTLQLRSRLVGTGFSAPMRVKAGTLELVNANLAAPVTVYGGAGFGAFEEAWVGRLSLHPGARMQVVKPGSGPGLRIGQRLSLDPQSVLRLERGAAMPAEAVLESQASAELRLDGVLLIGLRGTGWDPEERYALIGGTGRYTGQFADYGVEGALPAGYEGVLDYAEDGLWLAFQRALVKDLPRVVRPSYDGLHGSLALSSYYFPESVRQHYMSQPAQPRGLSGWVWHGGAHQRSAGKLRQDMSYFGFNWQPESSTRPINLGGQFGFEQGRWRHRAQGSSQPSWLLGISAEHERADGWGWLVGAAHHRYRLSGHREEASFRYHARLNQLYGQIHRHYGVQIEQGGRSQQWHIGPVAQLRLVQLNTPRIREQGVNAQQIEAKRYRYADISVGMQGAWQLTEGAQSVQITHSLKYHRWLGSRPLSKQHLSWQLGYQQQLNPRWQFGFSTQGRLGKGLRDQGLNFSVTGVF